MSPRQELASGFVSKVLEIATVVENGSSQRTPVSWIVQTEVLLVTPYCSILSSEHVYVLQTFNYFPNKNESASEQ